MENRRGFLAIVNGLNCKRVNNFVTPCLTEAPVCWHIHGYGPLLKPTICIGETHLFRPFEDNVCDSMHLNFMGFCFDFDLFFRRR